MSTQPPTTPAPLLTNVPAPQPDPIGALLHSRKFLLMVLDLVISIASYFVAKYAAVSVQQDVQFLTLALQPVFVTVIAAIAYEDAHA